MSNGAGIPGLTIDAVNMVTLANAGTPMMWYSAFYLAFGNAIIGILEGYLLTRLYKTSTTKTILLLILANYVSAILGSVFVDHGMAELIPTIDINNIGLMFWVAILATYIITLLIEFPFIVITVFRKPGWFGKSVRGTLIVQTLSYVLLVICCFSSSTTSIYSNCEIVDPDSMALPNEVQLYYISAEDGDVYVRTLTNNDDRHVYDLNATGRNDRLAVAPSSTNPGGWDLLARLETDNHREPEFIVIREAFASTAVPGWQPSRDDYHDDIHGTWFNFGHVPKLGDAESSQWSFWAGFWSRSGLRGNQEGSDRRIHIGIETPFERWTVRNATHLPTDKVVFQLGHDQICVYDPENNQIVLIVKGRGPIAVIDEDKVTASGDDSAAKKQDK